VVDGLERRGQVELDERRDVAIVDRHWMSDGTC
jgi:hypothetical protein